MRSSPCAATPIGPALALPRLRALAIALAAILPPAARAEALPRSEFHADCPFLVAAPSVLAVFDAKRWRDMIAAARVPLPYEASGTNFKRESIIVVTLPRSQAPIVDAALSKRRPERFDEKTGTLTLWYDVTGEAPAQPGAGATSSLGYRACVVTWTAARAELQQVVTRTTEGTYIAGARVAAKPKKKQPEPR